MTKQQQRNQMLILRNYCIDCLGYGEDEIQEMSKFELYELITDIKDYNQWVKSYK